MRLWTVHPRYLDVRGLTAAWREGLLAQKVLARKTRGYRNHPQLTRFRSHRSPSAVIAAYLLGIAEEAKQRGYRFNLAKISRPRFGGSIRETRGQLLYEWRHLKRKLRGRAPDAYRRFRRVARPDPHPLFRIVPGRVQDWDRR